MDFLDPKKQRAHTLRLIIGYIFVAIAILIGTTILLYKAYGFGLGKNGQVIQNGLLFVSSSPGGADIYINGKNEHVRTNTRLSLQSGTYNLELKRAGYRTWQQTINLQGGSIAHYDYPFLFPTNLVTTPLKTFDTAPGLVTQSLDKRWMLIQQPGSETQFLEYDLKNKSAPPVVLSLPDTLVTKGTAESWQVVEWASDNKHILLQHNYDDKHEFVLVDRTDTTQSINLDVKLNLHPTTLTLLNKKYDHYYSYDATTQTLSTTNLGNPTPVPLLDHVLTYQQYGDSMVLYASSQAATPGKVAIDLLQDGKTYVLREMPAGTTYLLNLSNYSNSWYATIGASSENKLYVYKNPVTQLNSKQALLVPIYVLKVPQPTYISASQNSRFIMDENGSQFSVFDAENDKGYLYNTKMPLDAPQAHATWMDGHRLVYVSGGKLLAFDFDHGNPQTLMPASSSYLPIFSPDYKFVDTLVSSTTAGSPQVILDNTSLRTPADQ